VAATPAKRVKATDNVFINCPFDDEYRELFTATVFAVVGCGFNARCALEADDGGQARMDKLYAIIRDCHYGIHDISRVELDSENSLPRFNMPLELGIFLGAKRYGNTEQQNKKLLVHDAEKWRYQKFISDLAGMDVKSHGKNAQKVIENIHSMLKTNTRRSNIPTKRRLIRSYLQFSLALPKLTHTDGLDHSDLLFAEMENLVIAWVKKDVQLSSLETGF
jgi:hypothetical protein